jgi:hypothetical protein
MFEILYGLIALALGLFVVLALILSWVAFFQLQGLKRKVAALEARERIAALRAVDREMPPRPGEARAPEPPIAPTPEPEPESEQPPEPEQVDEIPAGAAAAAPNARTTGEVPSAAAAGVGAADGGADLPPTPSPHSRAEGVEQALTSRWLVWLGAGTWCWG